MSRNICGLLKHMIRVKSSVHRLRLNICFIGSSKAGKNTALNAILGFRIAPSDVEPCILYKDIVLVDKSPGLFSRTCCL